jgi:DNA-binding NtrC family response regulator
MKRKLVILVVDDEESILKFFQRVLKKEEYTVFTADNGKEALELVNRKRPDLVILDLKMPGMNGIEILRQIKRIDENIEVIMITGYGTMKTARIAMRLGAYDYITKPFDVNYIMALIKDVLSPASDGLSQDIRVGKEISKGQAIVEKLTRIGHCKQKKACLWEVAVKAFVLGQDKISIDWMEDPEIPKQEKIKLMELAQIIKSSIARN